jgi:parvulin-like peptidyl-prolyl isomerase
VDTQSGKVARRRRKPQPRKVPSLVEQRERKPILFGFGSTLSHRERESVKERIALFAGIGLALIVGGLLGWGLLYDNVIRPNQIASENAKPVAVVGNYTLTVGFFKRFEQFRYNQLNSRLTQDQQLQPSLTGTQQQQVTSEISSLQQSLNTIPQDSESLLVDNQVVLQRSAKAGIVETPKDFAAAWKKQQTNAGGPRHLDASITASGLSMDEYQTLIKASDLQQRLAVKLASQVNPIQLQVRASHILLPLKQKAKAQQVLNLALAGGNFAKLAKKYSIDTASAKVGGDLGYFTKDRMVAPFANAAFKGVVGKVIPGLVKSNFGYHIIKVTGRKQAKLTASALASAKQGAYSNWLSKEKALLRVQYVLSPQSLPAVQTTPTAVVAVPQITSAPPITVAPAPTARPTTATKGKKK